MIQWFSKKLKNKKGFTLIELIVVIAILGILAIIAIPRLGGFSDTAEQRAVEADHRVLVAAAQMYYADSGSFTADETALNNYFDGGWAGFEAQAAQNRGVHSIYEAGTPATFTVRSIWNSSDDHTFETPLN